MAKFLNRIIWVSYLALVIVTPLLFTTQNSELFEVPKMLFVYFFATTILFSTLIKFVLDKKILIPMGWPLAAFIIFFVIQLASTFTSIDKFTSVFGYPSRLNGGLLSQFAYLVIFFCALINLDRAKAKKLTAAIVVAAFVVSLWGIPSHFGRDPSCYVLIGRFTSDCWQQDFNPKVRIFSTLGQPNWLAQYLVLILPLSLALFLTQTKPKPKTFWFLVALTLFLAFILTNSRAGFFGFLASMIIFATLLGTKFIKQKIKIFIIIGSISLLLLIAFGAGLFGRTRELVNCLPAKALAPAGQLLKVNCTQGPTESSTIRLIVWQGAFEVFKHYPLLGSGPETFAYSYYLFRPITHNETTEWNFFYNKAHNEFLNYLANNGILGFLSYLLFATVTFLAIAKIAKNDLLAKAALAALIGYQATIFFGFSTVATQLLFYLIIALILTNSSRVIQIPLNFGPTLTKIMTFVVAALGLWGLIFVLRIYLADLSFAKAQIQSDSFASISYSNANSFFPTINPIYLSYQAGTDAALAEMVTDEKLTNSLTNQAQTFAKQAHTHSPNNLLIIRRLANTYFLLAVTDKKYEEEALKTAQILPKLAPTDPQSYLSLAKIQAGLDLEDQAKKNLEYALKLKPDYREAKELLEQIQSKELQ